MTTIKRLTGIARSGFEPMGAYGGIPTRRELGGWKRMAPRRVGRAPASSAQNVKYIHGEYGVCISLSFSAEHRDAGMRYGFLSTYIYVR